jgi:hypothetical protein
MSRKRSRTDVEDALHAVSETVAASGRRARKKARKLAAKADRKINKVSKSSKVSGKAPKHKRSKKKLAFVLLLVGGAGVAARKAMSSKPAPASTNASYPTPASKSPAARATTAKAEKTEDS